MRRGQEIPALMQRAMADGTMDLGRAEEAGVVKSDCEASVRALQRMHAPSSCLAATQHMVAIASTLAQAFGGTRQDNWQSTLPSYAAFSDLKACAVDAKV
jgi:hypothetical protein